MTDLIRTVVIHIMKRIFYRKWKVFIFFFIGGDFFVFLKYIFTMSQRTDNFMII